MQRDKHLLVFFMN